jgi:chromosome segregation ATPase
MRPQVLPEEKLARLKQQFGNQLHAALDLLEFDSRLRPAVATAFGMFVVVENNDIAK